MVGAIAAAGGGGEFDAGARSADCGTVQLNKDINNVNANNSSDDLKNCKLKFSSWLVKLIGV